MTAFDERSPRDRILPRDAMLLVAVLGATTLVLLIFALSMIF